MDIDSAPEVPVMEVKQSTGKVARLMIGGGILILLLIAMPIAAYYFSLPFKDWVDVKVALTKVPAELKGSAFLIKEGDSYSVARIQGFSLRTEDVVQNTKATGSVSPSGTTYAYAQPASSTMAETPGRVVPGEWVIHLKQEGQATTTLVRGFAPAFLDETHLAYFSPGGIAVFDLDAQQAALLSPVSASSTLGSTVRYSPDRSLVLYLDRDEEQAVLARITPDAYTPLHIFKSLNSPVLTDTALYDVRALPTGTEFWKYSLDGKDATKIVTIPATAHIQSIVR